MVRGIGVDIMEISRIRQAMDRLGDRFLERVFTGQEIDYCKSRQNIHQHFAARFAAKEAVSKAISLGWGKDFAWKNVEVTNDPSGQPRITLHGRLREMLTACNIHLTISHAENHVVAMVLIEEDPK